MSITQLLTANLAWNPAARGGQSLLLNQCVISSSCTNSIHKGSKHPEALDRHTPARLEATRQGHPCNSVRPITLASARDATCYWTEVRDIDRHLEGAPCLIMARVIDCDPVAYDGRTGQRRDEHCCCPANA